MTERILIFEDRKNHLGGTGTSPCKKQGLASHIQKISLLREQQLVSRVGNIGKNPDSNNMPLIVPVAIKR